MNWKLLIGLTLGLSLAALLGCARAAEPTATPRPAAAPVATAAPQPAATTAPTPRPAATAVPTPTRAPAPTPAPTLVRPTEWTVILSEDTAEGDPFTSYGTNTEGYVQGHVMEALVQLKSPGEGKNVAYAGHLAESFEIPDDKTMIFHLRKGIKFHNGEEMTADNVKFSYDATVELGKTSGRRGINQRLLGEATVVDKYTIKWSLPNVYAPALDLVNGFFIAPSVRKTMSGTDFGKKPVGTGLYKAVQWERDKPVIMESNDSYWVGKKAFPTRLIFRYVPEPSTRVAELLAGRAQIANVVPIGELSRLASNPKTEVVSLKGFSQLLYLINLYVTDPPLRDKRVRQALNLAIDRETIVKAILEGRGEPKPAGVLQKDELGWTSDVKPYPYDPAKAKDLMKQAGIAGFTFDWTITQGIFQKDFEIAEAAAFQMAKLGIKANLTTRERARLLQDRRDGNYHIIELIWWYTWDRAGTLTATMNLGHPDDKLKPKWGDPPETLTKVRALMKEGESTLDLEKRRAVYERLNKYAIEEAIWLNIHLVDALWGIQKDTGWRPPPIGEGWAGGGDIYYDYWQMVGKKAPQ